MRHLLKEEVERNLLDIGELDGEVSQTVGFNLALDVAHIQLTHAFSGRFKVRDVRIVQEERIILGGIKARFSQGGCLAFLEVDDVQVARCLYSPQYEEAVFFFFLFLLGVYHHVLYPQQDDTPTGRRRHAGRWEQAKERLDEAARQRLEV